MKLGVVLSTLVGVSLFAACSSTTSGNGGDDTNADKPDARINQVICGDNECAASEVSSCPQDCGTPNCDHDSTCETGESATTCDDCSGGSCNNNGTCDGSENAVSCPSDCGGQQVCNNNLTCEPNLGENATNCSGDCGGGACNMDLTCDANEGADCVDCATTAFDCATLAGGDPSLELICELLFGGGGF